MAAYAVVGAELGLSAGGAQDIFSMPSNLWEALNLARNIRLQGEKDAADRASGKPPVVRGYNEDSEEYRGRP